MKDNELYKDNELTLSKLADATGVSSHMLSELLNVHMQTNFYELVNRYRLECAIGMLQVEATSSSIIDIALSAGFNNKNTFYRVFKEKMGVTPSAYRSRNRKMAS
ncbi:hypothetical protein PAUR_b0553 [Pseudoalteromonas aurantia 208]|uniref:HTH araC/xylS-type domain-containing protein n=1 Tax=Pseudoalteromonas aurantia 208 TaxID=1314867 RepID=A0ABR9EHM8_9GAMM|nr:hypothetical protein [Pseudoalteromonas aurantia 208]